MINLKGTAHNCLKEETAQVETTLKAEMAALDKAHNDKFKGHSAQLQSLKQSLKKETTMLNMAVKGGFMTLDDINNKIEGLSAQLQTLKEEMKLETTKQ
ncbi:hypothetical protein PN36_00775 [Candidatus Thiomargarita nelsonii]|uniref:Uncharacterized protein n=1 Tax=Candidatus Thiomargarita nelsonii TaxID=1003181 RepID=A0A0A6P6Q0_9GAMM|nr:hypothetical protein PN36_00775 [Candidatus Thiomargarita nelsonii]